MFSLLLPASMLATLTTAYTQVNVKAPFMNKNVDSIVFPGSYTKSHLHSFYGSDAVTASTNKSSELQTGCTNAENPNDLSVYWVPTVLYTTDAGKTYKPVPLTRFSAYYNAGETPAEIAIPQDLKMLAGSASATTKEAMIANAQAQWFCEGGDDAGLDANGFPSKTCATHLQQLLYFPQCVNPTTLETDYKNKPGGKCPAGMKSMAQLRFSIRYDLRKVLPNGWSGTAPIKLACGPAWCSHGDFINGWTPEAAEAMIATTQSKRDFSGVDGKLGKYNAGSTCKSADAEPDKGTSDYAESVKLIGKRSLSAWGWVSRSRFQKA
ncbi:secreted protein [Paraphoma chrysanthemicola]|uniref:Secreted protein n=1 Tax=Paraphoma chrysanthemicola TaxID=798071 RepID=A0A8K0RGF9_9PLEO|nr:secreted protein [Paraphoma chrysanthemicola]